MTILASTVIFVVAFTSAILKYQWMHMNYIFLSLVVFAHAVAVAYVSSVSKVPRRLSDGVAVSALLGLISRKLLLIPSLLMVYLALMGSKRNKGSMKMSLRGVVFSYFLLSLWSLIDVDPVSSALIGLSYPLSLIYSVSSHSLPRTYGDEPRYVLFYLSLLTLLLGLLDYRAYLISLIPYFLGAKYDRLIKYCGRSKEIGGVSGRALFYYCCGHAFAVASSLVPTAIVGKLSYLHALLLGFVTVHIFIHMPTMIPPIMGIRNARRYNCLPFVLSIIASLLWPYFKEASWILYSLGVISNVLVFLPLRASR